MSAPSFERIDYQLRYNKHIERRLIFDLLGRARKVVGLADHGYLGFGSMWFSDFRLAHRVLELETMVSMERKQHEARAKFNSPYQSIKVQGGDSTAILESFGDSYWSQSHIAWFDYDGTLSPDVVKDLHLFLDKCAPDSVVIVTLQGLWKSYRPRLATDQIRQRVDTAVGQVERLLGANVVHPRFEPGPAATTGASPDIESGRFPEFLADSLLAAMAHRIASSGRVHGGEGLRFVPLFNFCHEDMAEMVTVGGAVVSDGREAMWKADVRDGVPMSDDGLTPKHQRLDLVPLTVKEKMTLDACLPQAKEQFFKTAKKAGLKLHDNELAKYWQYFRQFPVFLEAPL